MKGTGVRLSVAALAALVTIAALNLTVAQQPAASAAWPTSGESPWPHQVQSGATTLTVYQPQLDSWDGFKLEARLAVQAQQGQGQQAVTHFGIVTVQARTLTDKSARTVTVDQATVVKSDFPSSPANAAPWGQAIAQDLQGKSRIVALERLESELGVTEAQRPITKEPLRNAPPAILFSQQPAILVSIDGTAVFRPEKGTPFERVINTRPLLLKDTKGTLYLKVFDGWLTSATLGGPWTVLASPGAELAKAFKQANDAHLIDPLTGQGSPDVAAPSLKKVVPQIYVATSPTELIVTQGAPKYVPIKGTRLLYVDNTTGNLIQDTADNRVYVLIAGRWFRAPSMQGPWEFVAANALPSDFAQIPDDSAKENVKASIAGTEQAREAAISAQVPQTAAVKVKGTEPPHVLIDGDPVYKPISGTTLEYVANTPSPIIRVSPSSYYVVTNGVWFTSAALAGPWAVATAVPAQIYTIPPSSPLHYVTYVYVYQVTSDTVYVGYTPGYSGAVIDPVTGVVVYGTGYAYTPWVGSVWYGVPVTYGYGASVCYTPWTGWAVAFGLGWAWGVSTTAMGWGWGPYPYWGPWAYPAWHGVAYGVHGGRVVWGAGGWAGYSGNIYRQWGTHATVSRYSGGYNAWTGNAWASQVGRSYNSRTGVASAGERGAVHNVYTGNYAAGERGVAVGPGGSVAVGSRGTAGNAYTGNQVSGGRGAVYNKNTGDVTTYGHVTGNNGNTVGHVGNDVYAGKDGNVYRNTGNGWEQHSSGGGWQPVPGSAQGQATRDATGGLGASQATRGLDNERYARQQGGYRAQRYQQTNMQMNRSYGGGFRRR
jgi:hypothetical protein